ncbi:l-amino acid oxidase [Fusarium subglutinans]|uniref:L-amino acid oxidase n=1 Tax=Gibberella subglutinans TaxID=42677 RepID=A0A8H5NQC0_GIBSU|nr:l-amino acid oxidase [Fusarium subglutinans]KAF5574897.1 l-amino acid oxidase [Fusarium subglutinans]
MVLLYSSQELRDMLSYRERWARRLVRDQVYRELSHYHQSKHDWKVGSKNELERTCDYEMTRNDLPSPCWQDQARTKQQPLHICIVGAGVSGLYIALLLDSLEMPGLTYEILEASNRAGGRVKTHYFSDRSDDYFDVGAMRFPEATHMQRIMHLFRHLNVPLSPYYKTETDRPYLFNNILAANIPQNRKDIFQLGRSHGGLVPDRLVQRGAQQLLADAVQPHCAALAQNFDQGFQRLMEFDHLSTSMYLQQIMGYDFHTVQWMESMTSATGLFDQAFSETVLDALDFDYSDTTPWWRIEGGGAVLISRMCEAISQPCKLNKAVVEGESSSRQYNTVFVTTTLPALQRMDLRSAGLHPAQRQAINYLQYDSATKVAIKFSHAWWRGPHGSLYRGGEAHTDLPLRVCVYPSCASVAEAPDQPAVLLCSYTWARDAQRIASLISDESPLGEARLVELLLRNLAELHAVPGVTYEGLRAAYLDHYAFAWDRDPHAAGAFAFFGPGQFRNLYPFLTRPAADGNLHIAGEAASPVHGWIQGSLESAYQAVQHFLEHHSLCDAMARLESQWSWAGDTRAGDHRISQLQVYLARGRGNRQHGL